MVVVHCYRHHSDYPLTVGEDFVFSLFSFQLRVISPRRAFATVSETVADNIAVVK